MFYFVKDTQKGTSEVIPIKEVIPVKDTPYVKFEEVIIQFKIQESLQLAKIYKNFTFLKFFIFP